VVRPLTLPSPQPGEEARLHARLAPRLNTPEIRSSR
jgi:hypothetical protein